MILRLFRILAAALVACAFISCGDDANFHTSEKRTLTQEVYVVPEGITGAVHLFYSPKKEVFLNINENVRIQAVFRLNGEVLDGDEAVSYYRSLLWKINGKKINIPTFRHSFQEPGEYDCILQVVDRFGDTLIDTTKIYVDTPSSITLDSPRDGYNQIDPFSKDEIILKWTSTGIDPWETASCKIYASNKKEKIWKNYLGSSDCSEKTSITGPIVPDRDTLEKYGIFLNEESISFYWGVIMTVSNSNGVQAIDTSNIFHFSTKLIDADSSILNIPIKYKSFSSFNTFVPDTRVTIKDANGNILKEIDNAQSSSVVSVKLAAQTGVSVTLQEFYYDEYKAESLKVDIPKSTVIDLDTVFFEDNIAPSVWPLHSEFLIGDPIIFSVIDKGSGFSPSKSIIHSDISSLEFVYYEPLLTITNSETKPWRIYIQVSDFAGNMSTPVFWNVTPKKDIQVLDGPYLYKEELE